MFERNTKNNSTYASLGNVFRNSKWSDLRVQNIKTSFVRQFYMIFLLIISLIIINSTQPKFIFVDSFYFLKNILIDLLEFVIITYCVIINILLSLFFSKVTVPIAQKILDYYEYPLDPEVEDPLTNKDMDKNNDYRLVNSLYKTSYSVNSVNEYNSIENLIKNNSSVTYKLDYSPMYATNLGVNSNMNMSISLRDLNKLLTNKYFISSSNNFSKDLDLMKSDRWLLKNSLLSDDLIRNTNYYTMTKKLIGSNITNSQLSNKNVWASTNISKLSNFNMNSLQNSNDLLNNPNTLFINHLNSSSIINFNFFEESRLFIANKYSFSNKLRYNLLTFDDKMQNFSNSDLKSLSNNSFLLNYNLFHLSLNFNINPFFLNNANSLTTLNVLNSSGGNFFITGSESFFLSSNNLNNLINLTSSNKSIVWNNYFN